MRKPRRRLCRIEPVSIILWPQQLLVRCAKSKLIWLFSVLRFAVRFLAQKVSFGKHSRWSSLCMQNDTGRQKHWLNHATQHAHTHKRKIHLNLMRSKSVYRFRYRLWSCEIIGIHITIRCQWFDRMLRMFVRTITKTLFFGRGKKNKELDEIQDNRKK